MFPAEPEEKQKEILNNTIPEGKDSGDLRVSHRCQCEGVKSAVLLYLCWCIINVRIKNMKGMIFFAFTL